MLSVESIVQALAAGILVGCTYGIMCAGLSIIFGTMRVINFAQGEFMMLGMYLAFYATGNAIVRDVASPEISVFLIAVLAAPLFYLFGTLVHRGLLTRVTGHRSLGMEGEGQHAQLILTLGLSLVLQNGAEMFFGSTPRAIHTALSFTAWQLDLPANLGSIFINKAHGIAAFLAVCVTIALYLFMSRARLGKALRAAADNPEAATYMGIDVERCHRVAFGIGVAVTAVAGGLVASYYPFEPFVGLQFVIIMYTGVVLGGVESTMGAFWGGLIIGLVQQLSTLVLPYQLQATAIFAVLLGVMMFRPRGLFGRVADRA